MGAEAIVLGTCKMSKQGNPNGKGWRVGDSEYVEGMNHRPDRPFSPCRKPHGLSYFPAPLSLKDSHLTYRHHPLFIHLSQQCEGTLLVIIKSL